MAFGSSKLGEAVIDVRVNTSTVDAGLKETEAKVEATTTKIGQDVERHVNKSLQQSVRAVTGFVGAFTAAAGVAAVFYKIGEAIGGVIDRLIHAKEIANDFRLSIQNLSVAQLTAEIEKQSESLTKLEAAYNAMLNAAGLTTRRQIEFNEKLATLEAERADAQARAAEKRAVQLERERAEAESLARKSREEWDERLAHMLEGIAKQKAAQLAADREVASARRKAQEEDARRRVQDVIDRRREARELGEAMAAEMSKAFSAGSFTQSMAGPIEEMTRRLEAKLDNLKYGGRL